MYHLLIEFGSHSQLTRLKPDTVRRAIAHLEGVLAEARAQRIRVSGGRRLYRFEEGDRADPQAVADRTAEAFSALDPYRADLAGYTFLLAYESSDDPELIMDRLTDELLAATDDEALLLSRSAYASLEGFLETQQEGDLFKFVGRREGAARSAGDIRQTAIHPRVTEAGVEALSEWLEKGEAPPLLCVRGGELDGARYTAEEILARLQGERHSWLTVHGDGVHKEGVPALATSLDTVGLNQAHHYLNTAEQQIWWEKKPLLERLHRSAPPLVNDALLEDFRQGFTLYLTAFAARMASHGKSPFLLILRYDLLQQSAVDLLDSVLAALPVRMRPVVVSTCDMSGGVRRLGEMRRVELRLFELSSDEFIERVDASLTEAMKRLVRVREAHEQTGGHLVSLHHYLVLLQERTKYEGTPEQLSRTEISKSVLSKLTQQEREILYVACLWQGRAPSRRFAELLEWLGYDGGVSSEALRRFAKTGLISDEERCCPCFSWTRSELLILLGRRRADQLGRSVATWLHGEVDRGKLEADNGLLALFGEYEEPERVVDAYRKRLWQLLDRRDLESVRRILQEPMPVVSEHAAGQHLGDIVALARARFFLLEGKYEDANRLLRDGGISSQQLAPEAALQRARAFFAAGNLGEAHTFIKRSIILFQDQQNQPGVNRASTDFGLCVLAMDHVADARNYLVGSRTSDAYERMRGVLYRAVTLFLQGSYSRVKETGAELERHASATGLREYELFALFVRARTAFELGQYEQSAQELSRFLSVARLYGREVAFRTGMLWLARSSVYLGELSHAHDLMDRYGGTPESLLFRAEAYEFEGRLRDALECAHSGYETSYAPTDQNVERIRWSSGFSNIEDLVVRDEPVLSRLLWAYAAYLNARTGEVESGAASLQELTRQRTIVESDPYNRIYFYLYSEVLAAAATTRDDRATVLGKSVRFVQDRASRIDNYSDKTAFLHKNYWNSRIVNVARHHNLFT